MIPLSLRISGFLSYLQPVELDFTGFDMACISGANGAGKSSLLDAITWALFGQARRKDESILNTSKANKAAEVTYVFSYEGNTYRVQRTKPREKSALLEFHIQDAEGKWRALTESTLRATEARICHTLRLDYNTFINASFFLQGKADQFTQQGPGDRKRILSTILGLEIWEVYKERAAEQRKAQEHELAGLDARMKEYNGEIEQEPARRERLARLESDLKTSQNLREARQKQLEALHRLEDSLKRRGEMVELLRSQAEEVQHRLETSRAQLEARQKEQQGYQAQLAAEQEIRATYQCWQEARVELERLEGVASRFTQQQAERDKVLAEIDKQRSLLELDAKRLTEQKAVAAQLEAGIPALAAELEAAQSAIETLNGQLARVPELNDRQTAYQDTNADLKARNQQLSGEMKVLEERIKRLEAVEEAACPLCGQPLSPADRQTLLEDLMAQGKQMGDAYRANKEQMLQVDQQLEMLRINLKSLRGLEQGEQRTLTSKISALAERLRQNREQVDTWQHGPALRLAEVRRILAEEDYAHAERASLAAMDEALRALGYDPAAHAAVSQAEKVGRDSEKQLRDLDAARAALEPLQRQIEGLVKQVADEEWQADARQSAYQKSKSEYDAEEAQLPDLLEIEDEVRDLQDQENRLRSEVGGAKQAVEVLKNIRQQQAALSASREGVTRQIARLKALERAFSKDGVPSLLIEQVLPEIEAQANDLLDRLSGGSMSVRFNTVKDYKDKNRSGQRETLDIFIADANGEREYELFSGGEAFRINFAIRLALSRVLARRAGARLQMLVIDEGFGSQDADGRQRLLEALNMVRPDFAKVLVITHLEELKDHFPARIEVEKTPQGSRVSVA